MADKKTTVKKDVKTTVADLRKLSVEELNKKLQASHKDLLEANKSLKADELANPHAVKKMRREVARIKTIICEVEKKPVDDSNNDTKGVK